MHKMRTLLVRFVHAFKTARLVYHYLLVVTIFVTRLSEEAVVLQAYYIILVIHSGMVRDVGVPALAVSSTIHHGSVSNSLSQLY